MLWGGICRASTLSQGGGEGERERKRERGGRERGRGREWERRRGGKGGARGGPPQLAQKNFVRSAVGIDIWFILSLRHCKVIGGDKERGQSEGSNRKYRIEMQFVQS